jgi:hypothetical protein
LKNISIPSYIHSCSFFVCFERLGFIFYVTKLTILCFLLATYTFLGYFCMLEPCDIILGLTSVLSMLEAMQSVSKMAQGRDFSFMIWWQRWFYVLTIYMLCTYTHWRSMTTPNLHIQWLGAQCVMFYTWFGTWTHILLLNMLHFNSMAKFCLCCIRHFPLLA